MQIRHFSLDFENSKCLVTSCNLFLLDRAEQCPLLRVLRLSSRPVILNLTISKLCSALKQQDRIWVFAKISE